MADETIEIIEKLIETCRDGQAGYLEAAEHARNAELKDYFQRQSLERSKFAGELVRVAQRLGETDPDRSPSIANKLHRAWIDLKHKLGAGDAGVLESVQTGEDNAKSHYTEALRATLPFEVHALIERQSESVSDAFDQVHTLCDVYKRAA
jgi:uncharacterized protein (TIGR02284 family)